jgi:L-aspartate oxidase
MGGIAADADGRTSLPGLWAAGECASTGVHGANRLASNSLLEAAAFGTRAGRATAEAVAAAPTIVRAVTAPELPDAALASLREAMTRHAGVLRERAGLAALLGQIEAMEARHGGAGPLVVARLVAACALARTESRGAHHRLDFPATAAEATRTRLRLGDLAAAAAPAAA